MAEAPTIRASKADGILRLTLCRPEKKNALDLLTLEALADQVEAAEHDPAVRVILLDAEGDTFCAGGDIEVMRRFASDGIAARDRLRGGLNRLVLALTTIPKPVVCAVQGNAFGAGAILAFQCDITLAASEATFSLSFRHVGLIPDTGGTWLLPRRVGLQRAKHLTWTAAPFSAADAAAWGLVLQAVPRAQLAGAAQNMANALAEGPATAMGLAKRAMHDSLDTSLAEALEREAHVQGAAFLSSEHAEGRNAFFDRRKPKFR